ncbi:hypothetical protein BED47_02710 [Gottfriedia luciferensis]|uniref:Uncharacterized protein n=1 Tax=Gottfriedia luciferensis TaxID=178774 RepID=A0ABX2ZTU1_9BACI|nr:hypothetical protein BED47_02710 [Gottfriedia luciferensis]
MLISTTGCSLSMGRDSLASSASLRGLSLPANPIGVEHPFSSNQLIHQNKSAINPNQIAFTQSNLTVV